MRHGHNQFSFLTDFSNYSNRKSQGSHHVLFIGMITKQIKIPGKIPCESFLVGILYLAGTLYLYENAVRRGLPYVHSTVLMVQLFIIKSWMRIPSDSTLHYFLSIKCTNDKLLKVCRLNQIPDRRTIDRRFQCLPINEIISTVGCLFVPEGCQINSVD